MSDTHSKIDRHLRRHYLRRALVVVAAASIFSGFMAYALYEEYGPGAEVVDIFPEVNSDDGQ